MSDLKRYEVRITRYATIIVSGKGLSADAACLAAKADVEADGAFTVGEARVVREVPDGDASLAMWNADVIVSLDT